MKTLLAFLFAFCFATGAALGQESLDVVRLKNGKVYRGQILRNQPGQPLELKVGPNNTFYFNADEIAQVSSEPINLNADSLANYGGGLSIGAAIGGGGLLGVPFRFKLVRNSTFEVGPYYRPFALNRYGGLEIKSGFMVAAALNLGMDKKYNAVKRKVIANGLFIRGGITLTQYKETLLGFGWASERFRRNNKKNSFISELGPGLVIRHWLDRPSLSYGVDASKVGFVLAWKVHWSAYQN